MLRYLSYVYYFAAYLTYHEDKIRADPRDTRRLKSRPPVNINALEIAVAVEGVGRPHLVVVNVWTIPDMDNVVHVHDF